MGLSYMALNFSKETAKMSLELLGLLLELLLQQQPWQLQGHLGNFFEKVQRHVAQPHLTFSKLASAAVEAFIESADLDELAANLLREQSPEVQLEVMNSPTYEIRTRTKFVRVCHRTVTIYTQ